MSTSQSGSWSLSDTATSSVAQLPIDEDQNIHGDEIEALDINQRPDPLDDFCEHLDENNKIGSGGFASVYRVRQKSDGCLYALKKIEFTEESCSDLSEGSDDQNTLKEVLKEVRILKTLEHLNIVSYFDHFVYEKHLFIRMELCNGSLAQILKEQKQNITAFSGLYQGKVVAEKPGSSIENMITKKNNDCTNPKLIFVNQIPWEHMQIFPQLLSAIEYLQSEKIVHRDIKPENIFMNGNVVKLGDFGLAKHITDHQDASALGGYKIGTPNYIAPELGQTALMIGDGQDPYKWDIYSLGIVYLEMALNMFNFDELENRTRERDMFFCNFIRKKPDWILEEISKLLVGMKNCNIILILKCVPNLDVHVGKLVPSQQTFQTLQSMLKVNPDNRCSLKMLSGTQDPEYDTVIFEDQERMRNILVQVCQMKGIGTGKL